MATKIYNTDTRETVELSLVNDGQDFLFEVISGCDQQGNWASEDMPENAEFAMNDSDLEWWTRWAEREQAILDKANEIGEDATNELCRLADEYSDMEDLQTAEEKYLGI